MPSGRVHDAITTFLAVPVLAAGYLATREVFPAMTVAAAFVIGGLMFGPDLDTVSRQYSRWWVLKGLWYPYRTFFKHRSRWSHGLVFGTLLRVIYFTGVVVLGGLAAAFVIELVSGERLAGYSDFVQACRHLGTAFRANIGIGVAIAAFCGLWLGAASHTFTDIAGTYIKTGKVAGLL
ncbi:MAG: metal-binding protein [Acidobacteriota bacterium]